MKVIVISPKNRTVYNFRGDLIRLMIEHGCEVVVTGPNRDNVDKITELGARFVELPMRKNGINPFSDLRYFRTLYKLFRTERPDVTFGYTVKPVIYGAIAAKLAKVKHKVSMVTGLGYAFTAQTKKARLIRGIVSLLYRIGFMCADTVVFQNGDDRKQLTAARLLKENKCETVNGSGVNMALFPQVPLPETVTFFMLARVMYAKGIREYLQACENIKCEYPQVRCMLLGACEDIQDSLPPDQLCRYVDEGIIEHFGETDHVQEYYAQCSVFVLPSYREGTPRTVLEAMSMGRPIITTDAPGCRETVIDGENGFLVPIKNSDMLTEKMRFFIENVDQIEKMGTQSRALCQERFDVEKVNSKMLLYLHV